MTAKTLLMLASAFITGALGVLHLAYTFSGPKLLPRDPGLVASMKAVPLVITKETTVWKAWIGFNASHSMAAILFGLVFGYLALARPEVLFDSIFLRAVGLAMLAGLAVLARVYWFSVSFAGVSAALLCYVASIVVARGA